MSWYRLTVVAALCLYTGLAFSETAAPAASPPDNPAYQLLQRTAETIAGAKQLGVTIDTSYDAVQADGRKLEFGATRKMLLSRPNNLRVDVTDRNGSQRGFRFDGKQIAVFDADDKIYATADKTGDIDAALAYYIHELQMVVPLAEMFSNALPQRLPELVSDVNLVEEVNLGGTICDHLTFRNAVADVQLWVSKDKNPLPQRIVITYREHPAQPQFRADFRDWNLKAKTSAAQFAFKPAKDAARIQFAAAVRQRELEGGKK